MEDSEEPQILYENMKETEIEFFLELYRKKYSEDDERESICLGFLNTDLPIMTIIVNGKDCEFHASENI